MSGEKEFNESQMWRAAGALEKGADALGEIAGALSGLRRTEEIALLIDRFGNASSNARTLAMSQGRKHPHSLSAQSIVDGLRPQIQALQEEMDQW